MNATGGAGFASRPELPRLLCSVVFAFFGAAISAGCAKIPTAAPPASATALSALGSEPLAPSPRLIVGRILAVDAPNRLAFVDLASDPPAAALAEGVELIARTLELRETARLQASRYVRGRTLGTRIVSGQPGPGDEVVWLAP